MELCWVEGSPGSSGRRLWQDEAVQPLALCPRCSLAGICHSPGSADTWSGRAGCTDFGTGLLHLEGLRHHPPILWHEVPSHGQGQARCDKIPVQEPEAGPSMKPRFLMGTGSARARLTPSSITAESGGQDQGEAILPRARGSGYLLCHQREHTGAALPTTHGTLLHGQHQLPQGSASSRDTGDTGGATPAWAWHPLPAVPTGQSKHPQQSPPVPAPALQTPLCQPQPCKSQPSSSKHPTWKEQHQHGHKRSPATSAQGKGQPETPKTSLGELSMEPNWPLDHQTSPAAIGNLAGPSQRPHACSHAQAQAGKSKSLWQK